VLSTAQSYLSIYRDPVVAKNVSRSDFRISDLMHGHQPATLDIVTEPVDKDRLKPHPSAREYDRSHFGIRTHL
jgi:type IV secretion system protein VirD4